MLLSCSTAKIDFDGLHDFTAAERRPGRAADQQDFVDIVMEDATKVLQVITAQAHADVLGDAIAHRVWMTKPLALDDLDVLESGRA